MEQQSSGTPRIDIGRDGRIVIWRDDRPIMHINPQDWIIQHVKHVSPHRFIAWDHFVEHGVIRWRVESAVELQTGTIHLLDQHQQPLASVTVKLNALGTIDIDMTARSPTANRVGFSWWSSMDEYLFGFGEYGNGPHRPSGNWSTWAEEGPVGLGFLSRWLRWTGRVPIPKGFHTTYAPIPTWLSSLGYGGWVDNTERIDWRVKGARRMMRIWSRELSVHLAFGTTLKEVIARRTKILEGPPLVPPWVLFPWMDAVQGQDQVQAVAQKVRALGIPTAVIWVEDWMGSCEDDQRFWMRPLSHRVDTTLYPDLASLAETLHGQGFKLLGYFCPEIAHGTPLYDEALRGGHLVHNRTGEPVDIVILGHHHGEPDLTQPDTRAWIKERWLKPLERLGFDGWMADFGEYLPYDSMLADGSTGWETHNRYPVLWQTVHRGFWDAVRIHGDYTFFVRSAGLRSSSVAPVMWGGDSDTDWDAADGLATVVPQALSAGLSGHALWGTDIAGYMTFGLTRPSTKELYIRWTELAALLPIMRTHHGTARPRNWTWDRDDETLFIFTRYARLHALLFPYLYSLSIEAHSTGLPLVRPFFLQYPDHGFEALNTQFVLGDNLMVAPVIKPGVKRQPIVFPPGIWWDWWSGRCFETRATIDTPLDRLPLFIRDGAVLPLLDGTPSPDFVTPGYEVTWGGDRDAPDPLKYLTIVVARDLTPNAEFHLPGGMLHVERTSSEPWSASLAPQVESTDHAPVLCRAGHMGHVTSQHVFTGGGVSCHWSGVNPLAITIRRMAPLG